jgi:hypothetical protein
VASIFDNLDLSNLFAPGGPGAFEAPPPAPPPAPVGPDLLPGGAYPNSNATPAPPPGGLLGGVDPSDPAAAAHGVEGAEKPGLLQRLMATSPDGLTFQDKLMAMGSILKGDSGGAQQYIAGQRGAALKANSLAEQKALLAKRSAAFNKAMASGKFDPGVYAAESADAFDPDDAAHLETAFNRRRQAMNAGDDIVDAETGRVIYQGHEKPGLGMRWDEALGKSVPDEDEIRTLQRIYSERYQAQNKFKKFAPRAGGVTGSHVPAGATPLPP